MVRNRRLEFDPDVSYKVAGTVRELYVTPQRPDAEQAAHAARVPMQHLAARSRSRGGRSQAGAQELPVGPCAAHFTRRNAWEKLRRTD